MNNPFESNNQTSYDDSAYEQQQQGSSSYDQRYSGYNQGGSSYGSGLSDDQLRQKALELERREQQLEYRERRVEETKVAVEKGGEKLPNWPVCKPMIYHDIRAEIPEEGRNMVKRVYFAWYLSMFVYSFNTVSCLIDLIANGSGGTSFGISLIFIFVGIPVSFVFWYRPFYVAVKQDRSVSYMFFFFNFACHIGFSIVMAIGIPSSGGGGFIVASTRFGSNAFVGIVYIVSGLLWAFIALYDTWQLKSAVMFYRGKGHTAQSARNDAIREAASSEAGKAAMVEAGKAAIKSV